MIIRNEDGEIQEPTPDQERAWDLREDDLRGHALDEAEAYWQPVYDSGAEGPFSPDE